MLAVASDEHHARPGMVAVIQTFSSSLPARPFDLYPVRRSDEDPRLHHRGLRHREGLGPSRPKDFASTSSHDPRRDLRSLSTTPAHATPTPPASRKHGFLFRSTRVRTISASPGPSPPQVRLLGVISGSCFPALRVRSSSLSSHTLAPIRVPSRRPSARFTTPYQPSPAARVRRSSSIPDADSRPTAALAHRSFPEYDWLNDLLHSGKSGTILPTSA